MFHNIQWVTSLWCIKRILFIHNRAFQVVTKLTRLLEIVLAKVGMFFKFKLLFADGARTIGASVCVCVCVCVCCEMYKFHLVALSKKKKHTPARNKTKKERKKRLAATCQSLFCLGLTKGLANIILFTGTRLAYTKREWDGGSVL